jgi:hypothetical protein
MKFPELHRLVFTPGHPYQSAPGWPRGVFSLPFHGNRLLAIATNGREAEDAAVWEHVSVTVRDKRGKALDRAPTWLEMCAVKNAFWDDGEVVMQLHPAKSEYVNYHPHCLHLWRPVIERIPTPPSIYVGPKETKTSEPIENTTRD